MSDADIDEAKAALRTMVQKKRGQFHATDRAEAAKAAARQFFASIRLSPAEIVAGYWAIRDEMDIRDVITGLMAAGQPLCLPVVLGPEQPLEMRLWQDDAPLYPSGFNTLAPDDSAPVVVPDVILMPLLGFDRQGTRLGYGGGYYDRTIASLPKRPRLIGFGFALQQLETIPREAHDIPLDAVVTENGVHHFNSAEPGA